MKSQSRSQFPSQTKPRAIESRSPIRFLALAVVLAPALAAQDDGNSQKPPVEAQEIKTITSGDSEIEILPDGSRIVRTTNKQGELVEKHIPPGDPAAGGIIEMPPDEMARRGGGYFDAVVMVRPRRLAAGESGDLYVHVTLRGHAVVLPGANISLTFDKAQGPLVLGSEELKPALPGVRETRYKGKPVWDDALTFKIPVTVRSDAKPGNADFAGAVRLEVSDGRTGEMIGRFQADTPGRIPIGRPLPRPVPLVDAKGPQGAASAAGAGRKPAPTAADAPGAGPRGDATEAKATGEGRLVAPASGGVEAEKSAPKHGANPQAPQGTFSLLDLAFWGVGGLLLLGLALLVMRRR